MNEGWIQFHTSLASNGCTVAEQSPHQPKVKGLSHTKAACSGNESGEKSQVHNSTAAIGSKPFCKYRIINKNNWPNFK
jgi:hypothetical protein